VIKKLRAVFDTNVFVSAVLTRNANSPTRELLERWAEDEFGIVFCDQLNDELIEKLVEREVNVAAIARLLAPLSRFAEWVEVLPDSIERVLVDSDDDVVLACAVTGGADYLVTYDPHFDSLNGEYRGVKIVKALPFLWVVRGDTPPESESQ